MPTYEYACDACGHEFTKEQSIKDNPVKTCPKCKKRKVQRLISQGNFILKGSGWYADGYSGASNRQSKSSTGSASSKPGTETKAKDSSESTSSPKPKKEAKASTD